MAINNFETAATFRGKNKFSRLLDWKKTTLSPLALALFSASIDTTVVPPRPRSRATVRVASPPHPPNRLCVTSPQSESQSDSNAWTSWLARFSPASRAALHALSSHLPFSSPSRALPSPFTFSSATGHRSWWKIVHIVHRVYMRSCVTRYRERLCRIELGIRPRGRRRPIAAVLFPISTFQCELRLLPGWDWMGNDEDGAPTAGVAKVRSGAERSRRAAPSWTIATMSATPMTHCLRINRRGTANSDEKRGLAASLSFLFVQFSSVSRFCVLSFTRCC